MNKRTYYDVVIVGAGIAGNAAAISLGQFNFKTLLVDKMKKKSFKVGEGLAPACNDLLKKLGALEAFILQKHLPSYGNASAWGNKNLSYQDFLMQGNGWHIDRQKFESLLLEKGKENVSEFEKETVVQKIEKLNSGNWLLKLKNQKSEKWVETKFLIDASGRSSVIGKKIGLKKRVHQRMVGFWKIFKPTNQNTERESLTLIEAAREGWWYTALLPSGDRIVVFFTSPKSSVAKHLSKNIFFQSLLQQTVHIKSRLKNYQTDPLIFPKAIATESANLSKYVENNYLAIGDAAMSFDPISSQGIPNALYSGMMGAEAIGGFLNGNKESFDNYQKVLSGIWKRYEHRLVTLYLQEQRWKENSFWKEKHQVGNTSFSFSK